MKKTIESNRINIASCFNAVTSKKTQGFSFNLFVSCQNIFEFALNASSALRNYPPFLALTFIILKGTLFK